MVSFSLLSSVVTNSKNDKMAKKYDKMAKKFMLLQPETLILLPSSRYGVGFGKPNFPVDVNMSTSLCDLITRDSWFSSRSFKLIPASCLKV